MKNIQITSLGIKKALRKYTYSTSISEYVWNGFDAKATKVFVSFKANPIGNISEIKISDNGHGISDPTKFQPFYESDKEIDPNATRVSSVIHGKNGVGRLTFFTFASIAKWETIYEKNSKRYKYSIEVDFLTLDKYVASSPVETSEETGTVVYFRDIHTITANSFDTDIKEFLCREFGWFLELNSTRNFSIELNGIEINYRSTLIGEEEVLHHKIGNNTFSIKFIRWLKSLNREYSRYYLVSSEGDEKYTSTTTLNNRGDNFFHSVFIESAFFNTANVYVYETSLFKNTEEGRTYKSLMSFVDKFLRDKRKPFLKKVSDEILENFERSGAFPKFKNNTWDQFRKTELEDFIKELYQVEPKIFTSLNIEQKKVFVHFLNLIIDSGERDKLIEVLGEIVTLESFELEHLAESLKVSKLSNIIRTVRLIEDRYKAI